MIANDFSIRGDRTYPQFPRVPQYLEWNVGQLVRCLQQIPATAFQDPTHLSNMTIAVLDVLKDIKAHHEVERPVLKWKCIAGCETDCKFGMLRMALRECPRVYVDTGASMAERLQVRQNRSLAAADLENPLWRLWQTCEAKESQISLVISPGRLIPFGVDERCISHPPAPRVGRLRFCFRTAFEASDGFGKRDLVIAQTAFYVGAQA